MLQTGNQISLSHYWTVNVLLFITAILIAFGLIMPLITFKQLMFFSNTFSILSGITALYTQKQYLLFAVVLLFSVLLPSLKIGLLFINWNLPSTCKQWRRRLLVISMVVARWSMLDVFAVAVFVVSMKINLIAKVETHQGLVIFTFAVISLMLLTTYIVRTLSLEKPI